MEFRLSKLLELEELIKKGGQFSINVFFAFKAIENEAPNVGTIFTNGLLAFTSVF